MKLHRLTVSAFGPFGGTETVDLDDLSRDGVFLLHGPTGAGKTSVLDAVCFALYGRVPGARGAGARLRSDHADPGTAPEVQLEFSVGTRRLRIRRSPAWDRPKRRGTGTTTTPAHVVVEELCGDVWQSRTNRLDEAGLLMEELLGLRAEQFTTLVMLPQGEFATFLRADAETRRKVLERLFRTDRFSVLQAELRQRRADARRDAVQVTGRLRDLVARAGQAARSAGPLGLSTSGADSGFGSRGRPSTSTSGSGATDPAAGGVAAWTRDVDALTDDVATVDPDHLLVTAVDTVAGLRAAVLLAAEDAVAHRAGTQARAQRASAELVAATSDARAARRRQELQGRLDRLTRGEAVRRDAEAALQAAARADTTAVELDRAHQARAAVTDLHTRRDQAFAHARTLGVSVDDLDDELARSRAQAAALDAVLPVVTDQRRRVADLVDALAREQELEGRRAEARRRQDEVARERAELAARREALLAAASGLDGARARLAAAARVESAAVRAGELAAEHDDARASQGAAAAASLHAHQVWLDLREARLQQMAAELARGLVAGSPCPVCGGTEHPSPAPSGPGIVDPDDEEDARARHEQLAAVLASAEQRVAALGAALEAAREAAEGRSPVDAQDERVQAQDQVAACRAAVDALAEVDRDLAATAAAHDDACALVAQVDELTQDAQRRRDQAEAALEAWWRQLVVALHPLRERADLAALLPQDSLGPQPHTAAGATAGAPFWDGDGQGALFAVGDESPPDGSALDRPASDEPDRAADRLDQLGATDWAEVVTRLLTAARGRLAAAEELAASERDLDAARDRRTSAESALRRALETAGFADEAAASRARLEPARRRELEALCREHDDEVAAVRAALAELGDDGGSGGTAPDPDRAAARVRLAEHAAHDAALADDEAVSALARVRTAMDELDRLGQAVTAAARTARPVLHRLAHLDALARCADGTGGDNRLRMTLSAFVLAARLEQVAQAATVRLAAMSGGRYGLVHHDGAGSPSRGRTGLDLRVVDTWTGTERETGSLSGGEAFYASLALALGLADVVRAEAGGAVFDTLFIDEGFGSLDPDTLDEVLDTIDDLRTGGRVVGIVSHVADLRDRIPARLEVVKGRGGSRLREVAPSRPGA